MKKFLDIIRESISEPQTGLDTGSLLQNLHHRRQIERVYEFVLDGFSLDDAVRHVASHYKVDPQWLKQMVVDDYRVMRHRADTYASSTGQSLVRGLNPTIREAFEKHLATWQGPAKAFRDAMNAFLDQHEFADVHFDFSQRAPDHVHIEDLSVPFEFRSRGLGKAVMEHVLELAEKYKILVSLQPAWTDEEHDPHFGLHGWYENIGFHDGYTDGEPMELDPCPWKEGKVHEGELIFDGR